MIADPTIEDELRDLLTKASADRAKLLIAARAAVSRMKSGGFNDAIVLHMLEAAIRHAERT